MPSISAIFFDLDGTLVDSSIGIHNAFTHTFKELGVPSPDAKTIRGFMGPPLESSFATCLPKEQISEAVQIYRSYYKEKGIHEAQLFPRITELLQELSQNYPLYITTTKNTPTAHDMTKNLGIHHSLMAFTALVLKRHIRQMSSVTPCKRINSMQTKSSSLGIPSLI